MSVWRFDYPAHAAFVAPARAKPQVWRIGMGLVLAAGLFLALNQMVFGTLLGLMDPEAAQRLTQTDPPGQTAGAMLFLLCQLGLLAVSAALVVIVVHGRRPWTLIGDPHRAVRQFAAVSVAMVLLTAAVWLLPPYPEGGPMEQNMPFGRWLLLLPFALTAVLIQSGAEEVFFRGYLQQQLAARFNTPLVWMVGPAALFGLGHYYPESAGTNATTIALWAVAFGLLMADLTARAGTLGPAMAIHFFNNVTAMVLMSPPDEMSGLSLYLLPFGYSDEAAVAAWLPVDFAWMFVAWLAARVAIRA